MSEPIPLPQPGQTASTYHVHGAPICTQLHDAGCPNPRGQESCVEIDSTHFGCTHVYTTGDSPIDPEKLEQLAVELGDAYLRASKIE